MELCNSCLQHMMLLSDTHVLSQISAKHARFAHAPLYCMQQHVVTVFALDMQLDRRRPQVCQ
jgi:hypothetical protein